MTLPDTTSDEPITTAQRRVVTSPPTRYEPPRITRLGTLADLTRGGDAGGQPDGYGEAGSSGFIP